jgi:hypothetical protein
VLCGFPSAKWSKRSLPLIANGVFLECGVQFGR